MRTFKTLSLLGLLITPLLASAAGPASAPTTDLTKAEFIKQAEARFAALDTNKDGKITAEERHAQGRGRGMGASMPTEMTREQHLKFAEERFAALDTNKDGKVSLDERRAQHGQFGGHGHHGGAGAHGMGPGASMPAEVTRAQHMKLAEEHFNALDTNKDGKVTQEERQALRGKFRGMQGGHWASAPATK